MDKHVKQIADELTRIRKLMEKQVKHHNVTVNISNESIEKVEEKIKEAMRQRLSSH